MTKRTVYRIETPDGKGICSATGSKLCRAYRDTPGAHEIEHCSLYTDEVCHWGDYWLHHETEGTHLIKAGSFAFPSLDALKNWFPSKKGRAAMAALGGQVDVWEVEAHEMIETPWQVVFDKSKATKVNTMKLEDI